MDGTVMHGPLATGDRPKGMRPLLALVLLAVALAGCLEEGAPEPSVTATSAEAPEDGFAPVRFRWDLSTAYNASLRAELFDNDRSGYAPDLPDGTAALDGWVMSILYRSEGDWPDGAATPSCEASQSGKPEPAWVYDCEGVDVHGLHVLNETDDWRFAFVPLGPNGTLRIGFPGNATVEWLIGEGAFPEAWTVQADPEGECWPPITGYIAGLVGEPAPGHGPHDLRRIADRDVTAAMPWIGICDS